MNNLNNQDLEKLRQDYSAETLDKTEVDQDPIVQFKNWMGHSLNAQILEPNAMILGTSNAKGIVTQRTVLLKALSKEGFVWYTNYESQKAIDLEQNPNASLLFLWLDLQRQVRIEGKVEKVSKEQSEAYFQSRPKKSQMGAWASQQSKLISDRSALEKKMQELSAKYEDLESLPLPENWGGYRLRPEKLEFWQGRRSRLHDRICYEKQENNAWKIYRLAP